MKNLAVKFAVWLLKQNLSLEHRALLINAILDRLAMLPVRSIIDTSEDGSLIIRGKKLDFEEQNLIHESAKSLKMNRAFGLIQDEILYVAMTYAVNGTTNFDQLYASKMAVWWGQNEHRLVNLLCDTEPIIPHQRSS